MDHEATEASPRRSIVLVAWDILMLLLSSVLELYLRFAYIVLKTIIRGGLSVQEAAFEQFTAWNSRNTLKVQKIRRLLHIEGIPSDVQSALMDLPEVAEPGATGNTRSTRRSRQQVQRPQDHGGSGAFYSANPLLHAPGPDGRPHWRLDRSRPPRDHYDGNHLVPRHFSVAPAMTPLEEAYSVDPESHSWRDWKARNIIVRTLADGVLAAHSIPRTGRYGLYICGNLDEVIWHSDGNGHDGYLQRDRMMVFLIELKSVDSHKWYDIHDKMSTVMVAAGIEEYHGVCIRYYEEADSTSPTATPRPRSRYGHIDFQDLDQHESEDEMDPPPAYREIEPTTGPVRTSIVSSGRTERRVQISDVPAAARRVQRALASAPAQRPAPLREVLRGVQGVQDGNLATYTRHPRLRGG